MNERVAAAIREAVRDHGPIGFDGFMELALYGPGGFYEEPPVGTEGDFVTSPHVHEVFSRLLGTAVGELHELLGRPSPFRVTEVGAGDGTLAAGLVEHLGEVDARRRLALEYTAVERSPGSLRALRARSGIRAAETLPSSSHVLLAHELLDNLPFRLLRGGLEVQINADGDRLVERSIKPDEELASLLQGRPASGPLNAGPDDTAESVAPPDAAETVVPTGALAFIDLAATRLAEPGYVLLIDYGAVGEPSGPVHGYRAHRIVEDLLTDPGSTDITAGVDFAWIARRAESHGLTAYPSVTQRHALTALGFETWIREELRRQAVALDEDRGIEAVRTWSGRSRATLLVDPTALGQMRWLLLATEGLPAPSFIA